MQTLNTKQLILNRSQALALANILSQLNNVGGTFKRLDFKPNIFVLRKENGFKVCRYNPGGVLVSAREMYNTHHDFFTAYGL